jgi:shikimate kinase
MSQIHILYIIGFMGSGKTTTGKRLASSLGWSFVDLDKKIEEHTGMQIPDIFSQFGEDHFRKIESEVLKSLVPLNNTVVSTGGGTPCFGTNMEFMLATGLTVYLKLSPAQLVSRLSTSSDERPLIKDLKGSSLLQFIEDKLIVRSEWYEKSKLIVDGFEMNITNLDSIVRFHLRSDEQ